MENFVIIWTTFASDIALNGYNGHLGAKCRQCKKACENNHVYVRELPDTQALPLCRIKERVAKGTRNVWGQIGQIWDILVPEVGGRTDKIAGWLMQVISRFGQRGSLADGGQVHVRTRPLALSSWPSNFFRRVIALVGVVNLWVIMKWKMPAQQTRQSWLDRCSDKLLGLPAGTSGVIKPVILDKRAFSGNFGIKHCGNYQGS